MIKKFFDYVALELSSGDGGVGAVSFRREKRVPKGGPDGGDGGRGGHIVIKADARINTFSHLYGKRHFKASNGQVGRGSRCAGKDGVDTILKVPVGTVLRTLEGHMIREFKEAEMEFVFLKGGIGGRGNYHFKTSVNQKPEYAQSGVSGNSAEVVLEVKLIADIGLVGFPNAGKSTLLSVITQARPKIAGYPFTTIKPELGVFRFDNYSTLTIADIPGIIEGAHEGNGLGIEFLKHIERTSYLLYVIDALDSLDKIEKLRYELKQHSQALYEKSFSILINKMDLVADEDKKDFKELVFEQLSEYKDKLLFFSSHTRYGEDGLKKIFEKVITAKNIEK